MSYLPRDDVTSIEKLPSSDVKKVFIYTTRPETRNKMKPTNLIKGQNARLRYVRDSTFIAEKLYSIISSKTCASN